MSSTMDKLKDKLHIRRKSQSEDTGLGSQSNTHASDGTSYRGTDSYLGGVPLPGCDPSAISVQTPPKRYS